MSRAPLMRVSRASTWAALALAWSCGSNTAGLAQDMPEIVKVRVPAASVQKVFPAGSELRVLPPDEFRKLESAASEAARRGRRSEAPAIIRARHEARWDGEALSGKSEFLVRGVKDPGESSAVLLHPWSPAIVGERPADGTLSLDADRRLRARLGLGPDQTLSVVWEQRARAKSNGRSFDLALPSLPSCRLALDLPLGMIPEAAGMVRQSPSPSPEPGRQIWKFDGPGGVIRVILRSENEAIHPGTATWVHSRTVVDASSVPAVWLSEWTIDPGSVVPSRLVVELDPGLELIEVTGRAVSTYRSEPMDTGEKTVGVRVIVDIGEGDQASPIQIKAVCSLPQDAPWKVPAASPRDAVWLGGRTLVHLPKETALSAVRELSGRQVSPRKEEIASLRADSGLLLAFEGRESRPVAELSLINPPSDVSAEVRGQIVLSSREPARIEAQLTWKADRGRLVTLSADLPAGWSLEQVHQQGSQDPLLWHCEKRPGSGDRLVVRPPLLADSQTPLTLTLSAVAVGGGLIGPLDLPRVSPSGAHVTEEIWVIRGDPALLLTPTRARGLTWLDPQKVPPLSPEKETKPASSTPVIAYRWTATDGRAVIDRSLVPPDLAPEMWVLAEVNANRLILDYYVSLRRDAVPRDGLVMGTSGPLSQALRWRSLSDPNLVVESTPVAASEQSLLGFRAEASAWRWKLQANVTGRALLHARSETPWSGSGEIPLLAGSLQQAARGTLLVSVGRGMRSEIEAKGLTLQDLTWTRGAVTRSLSLLLTDPERVSVNPLRPAHALGYGFLSEPVRLTTEDMRPATTGGLVNDATLRTFSRDGITARHELSLGVLPGSEAQIEIEGQPGLDMNWIHVDGRTIRPIHVGNLIRIPLPAASRPGQEVEVIVGFLGPLKPTIPRCSLPILSLSWTVAVDELVSLSSADGSLVESDLTEKSTDGLRISTWRMPSTGSKGAAATLGEFDARVRETSTEGLDLGEWFTRLDSGSLAIVVDRLALAESGLWPRTKASPGLAKSPSSTQGSHLASLGLRAEPFGRIVLITSEEAQRLPQPLKESEPWDRALRVAATQGSDATDRYQSVGRWRREPSRAPRQPGGVAHRGGITPLSTSRFAAMGTPGLYRFQLVRSSSPLLAVLLGVVVFLLLGWAITYGERIGLLGVGVAVSLGLGLLAGGPVGWRLVASSVGWASMAAAGFWLGRVWFRRNHVRHSPNRSTIHRRDRISRPESGIVAGLLMAWVGPLADSTARQEESPPRPRILVAEVYDGDFDPSTTPSRVVMKLADFDQLTSIATPPPPMAPAARLTDALHELRRQGANQAQVASEFVLWCDTDDPTSWTLPLEGCRNLHATLDSQDVPIAIDREGKSGTIGIRGRGRHRLLLNRTGMITRVKGVDRLVMAIPPMASARFHAEIPGAGEELSLPYAFGLAKEKGGILKVNLGPVATLDARWSRHMLMGPPVTQTPGLVTTLWDIEPAGDRLHMRLTSTQAQGLPRVALRLEPGLFIGSVVAPGVAVETSSLPLETGVAWEAQLDPPLPEGESISIELWAPRKHTGRTRELPRVEVLSPTVPAPILGVRRPDDWGGRLDAGNETERVADDRFAALWGPFPSGFMTLAGATKVLPDAKVTVETGPVEIRARLRPAAIITLAPGRLDFSYAAEGITARGASREAEAIVPADLRIVRVEAPGLTSWTRISATQLRLRFDGEPTSLTSTIRISGSVPLDGDPLTPLLHRGRSEMPWVRWPHSQVEPGILTIAASGGVNFSVDTPPGVQATVPAAVPGATSTSAFNIAPTASPGVLSWWIEPTGVNVKVQSLITLHPRVAEWAASATYAVPWGPCPPIRFRVANAWADVSQVEILGSRVKPQIDRGPTFTTWMLVPERPIWGSLHVRITGRRDRPSAAFLDFPDLVPLGRAPVDRVESYLGYADASGNATVVEGSAELQAVDMSRWDETKLRWPPAPNPNIYRVIAENWTLRFGPPAVVVEGADSEERPRVGLADLTCTLSADGSLLGHASYLLSGRGSAFLPLNLPNAAFPLSSSVDGRVVPSSRDLSGRILIPLPESGASRVEFVWKADPGAADSSGRFGLKIPVLEDPGVSTLITISAAPSLKVTGGQPEVSCGRLALSRARHLAQSIADRLPVTDRSAKSKLSALLGDCIEFELLCRAASRANLERPGPQSSTQVEALARIRLELDESLSAAGFGDYLQSSRARVGFAEVDPLPGLPASPSSSDSFRVRPLGPLHAFETTSIQDLSLSWSRAESSGFRMANFTPMWIGIIGFLCLAPLAGHRPRLASTGATIVTLLAILVAGAGWLAPLVTIGVSAIGGMALRSVGVRASVD